ncbi:Holliday junction resolvase RuvX [Fulvivirgaceae bacterium BMA12]|uniref:Putative pre-16S rRNA nuclease n=1 Tax=Agaribacillus aureus TaxID=3051825 RepID=A0ABT8L9W8_9BACT|nr:Holliday junction resolvase RuvX [Fulvivirgaceae bacterium BMA12]
MARIVAIDYGTKRVGIAVTDPARIIASPLTTVHANKLIQFLKDYEKNEGIALFVIGLPKNLTNKDTDLTQTVRNFITHLKRVFPDKKVFTIDERFTSKIAFDTMLQGGMKKKERRNKENIDKISATIILQSFLEQGSVT